MVDNTQNTQQFYAADQMRLRDIEEKMRLLKERTILIGQSLIESREKNSSELREIKKSLFILQEDISRIKDFISRITEQTEKFARKEELSILQRQFDLFRKK